MNLVRWLFVLLALWFGQNIAAQTPECSSEGVVAAEGQGADFGMSKDVIDTGASIMCRGCSKFCVRNSQGNMLLQSALKMNRKLRQCEVPVLHGVCPAL